MLAQNYGNVTRANSVETKISVRKSMYLINKILLKYLLKLKGHPLSGSIPEIKSYSNVEICPFKYGCDAAVCISIDLELNWAWRFENEKVMNHMGNMDRENVPFLLNILDKYSIPTTWIIIGHLFLENCQRFDNGKAHFDMPQPRKYWNWKGDWYAHDPCSDYKSAPLWYGPDLVEMILSSRTKHEIGTHSFSHINFEPEYCSKELAEAEILKCKEIMSSFSLSPSSFAFPFNKCSDEYYSIFRRLGIIAVRYKDPRVSLSYPVRDMSGVWKIYQSILLRDAKYYEMKDRYEIYIEEAREKNQVFHIWFHPSNQRETKFILEPILSMLKNKNDKSEIWLATMKDLAEYCENRNKIELSVINEDKKTWINIIHHNWNGNQTEISLSIRVNSRNIKVFHGEDENSQISLDKNRIKYKDNNKIIVTIPITDKHIMVYEQ